MARRTKCFKAGSIEGTGKFGYGTHTPWEEFQNTISTRKYQQVIEGTSYPKRAQFNSDEHWLQAMKKTENGLKPAQTFRKTVY